MVLRPLLRRFVLLFESIHAAIAVEDLAARGLDGELLDAIALGRFAVHFGLLDLQLPEAGDEEQEDADGEILERSHFARGEAGIVAEDARVIDFSLKVRIEEAAHGGRNYPVLL